MRPARLSRCFVLIAVLASPATAGPTGTPAGLPDWLGAASEAAVRATLGAPQSASFRKMGAFRLSDGGWAVCGEVNSRNLTGLAMGWKPVFLRYRTEPAGGYRLARRIVDWPADVACRQLAMGRPLRTRERG